MPQVIIYADTSDNMIQSTSPNNTDPNPAIAGSYSKGISTVTDTTYPVGMDNNGVFYDWQYFFKFDTGLSNIPAGAIITSSQIDMYVQSLSVHPAVPPGYCAWYNMRYDFTTVAASDWRTALAGHVGTQDWSTITTSAYNNWGGAGALNLGSGAYTGYCLAHNSVNGGGYYSYSYEYLTLQTGNGTNPPKLTVNYIMPSGQWFFF